MQLAMNFVNAADVLAAARGRAALSLRELGRLAGTSHATLIAYESGRKVPSVETFLRILQACGFAPDIALSPRIRRQDGIDRGEELAQVLRLAEVFPHRAEKTMSHPIFPRPIFPRNG